MVKNLFKEMTKQVDDIVKENHISIKARRYIIHKRVEFMIDYKITNLEESRKLAAEEFDKERNNKLPHYFIVLLMLLSTTSLVLLGVILSIVDLHYMSNLVSMLLAIVYIFTIMLYISGIVELIQRW